MNKRIAIVTGASSGFGVDYVKQIEARYNLDSIWLIARREERLIAVAAGLTKCEGIVIKADLTLAADLNMIKKKIEKEQPHIHILVNNAGFGRTNTFAQEELDYTTNMLDLNIKALVYLSRISIPFMHSGSSMINIASSAAFSPLPFFNVYAASKTFVLNFSNALSVELKQRGIKVLAVCPGPADTEFFQIKQGDKRKMGARIAPSSSVVRKSFRDLHAGKLISVYGLEMNIIRLITPFIPRKLLLYIAGKIKESK